MSLGFTGGGVAAPIDASYITQTPNATLTGEQALSTLATGILKNATGSGVLSIASLGTDYYGPTGTDVPVADGGTGVSTLTAYAPIFGGTAGTNPVQSGTVGTAGQLMVSNGAGVLPTFQTIAYEVTTNKATTFGTVNDTLYPSVQAVKTYADGLVVGLLDDRGNYDASVNTFPAAGGSGTAGAILKGDLWYISVPGTLGAVSVIVGDTVRALVDTPGQTAGNWDVLQANIGYTPENAANKVTSVSGASTDTQYPTAKLLYDQLALKAALISPSFTTPVLGTPTSGTLTNCTGLPIAGLVASTSTALGVGTIELGHASDTTIARSAAGAITVEGVAVPTISSTNTFTNKRTTKRITTISSSATPTINSDDCDAVTITALAAAITSMTTNLTGTPTNFQSLLFRIKDDGTGRAITWGASFVAKGVALPTTTVASKLLTVGFLYDTVATTWGCVASSQEA
jgi:hypothetical protein